MRTLNLRALWLGCGLLVLSVQPLAAQDPQEQPPPGEGQRAEGPDSITLVFEREIFIYPQYQRRDPFEPLTSGNESGPRFEELQLLGIMYSSDPGGSVALLGPRADQTEDPAAVRTYRVRSGDRLGNIRILQIQETRIVVEIEEFGMREQRIMELPRPGQGGLS